MDPVEIVLWEELSTVSMGDQDWLELLLTLAEFSEALLRLPTNKSLGMDGLTVEFYCVFWDVLGPDLVIIWAESLQSGVLPLSCRRALLTLLPKKGDRRDLRNWHPVSLLSMDYKVVAKAISLRLGTVLADMVHPDQTYTFLGCSILDNLYLVRDLLELGCRDGLSFALLSLDQEKAFDRVDHGYLLSTLRAFGFGPQFVGFLRVLYTSAECLVRLNWTLTEPVSFGRGVWQGCPLLGQLYALAIKPFLCLICRRLTEPLAIIFENSWRTGEVPDDWKKANVVLLVRTVLGPCRGSPATPGGGRAGPETSAHSGPCLPPPGLQRLLYGAGSVVWSILTHAFRES
ncbi:unnamed protein product [Lepidochelys olivacea]